jgi:hypothetical protein
MKTKDRAEYYEKLYFQELDSRNKIENRLRLPFTIFAIVFAMVGFLFNEALVVKNVTLSGFFWLFYISSTIALILSIFFFVKAWYGYTYLLMPEASIQEGYYSEILESYRTDYPKMAESWASEAFQEYLLATYSKYASHNTQNNDKKSDNLHKSITSLLISFTLASVSYLPYYNAITLDKPHAQKENIMSDKPAPPPPPPRNVKGEEPRKQPPKPEKKS